MTKDAFRELRVGAACGAVLLAWGMSLAAPTAGAVTCDKVASPLGSDAYAGTVAEPYATAGKLANSLSPGQTGCLRAGVFQGAVRVSKGGGTGAPTTITSYPGERATVVGRFTVVDAANHVTVTGLDLDGRNEDLLPSPTINGDHVTFAANDVTNHHTTICFLLGSDAYGRARDTVIERNRIHNCGQLPATNHHHGIYVEASDRARITDNWIYDNADRGVQLFPDAQETYIARNVIDGNGQGIIFSRESAAQPRREQRDLEPGAAVQHRVLGADRRRQRGAAELRLEHAARGQRRHPAGPRGGHGREQGHRAEVPRQGRQGLPPAGGQPMPGLGSEPRSRRPGRRPRSRAWP